MHQFGGADAKSVDALWQECRAGEARLRLNGPSLVREVDVVVVNIRSDGQVRRLPVATVQSAQKWCMAYDCHTAVVAAEGWARRPGLGVYSGSVNARRVAFRHDVASALRSGRSYRPLWRCRCNSGMLASV